MTNLTLSLPNKLINNRYYLYQSVANSNYSQVFLARDFIKHRKCIVKQLDLNFCAEKIRQTRVSLFEQEAKILQHLTGKHRQISQFYSYFSADSSLYLVQEWIAGITLKQKLQQQKKLSESETRSILLNLLSVLDYIHNQGIVHRDIKPNNIVLRSGDNLPVLIDFGVAQQISDREAISSKLKSPLGYLPDNCHPPRVIAGTPGYMSLEQAMGQASYNNDLYSLALTAIHLLTGRSPLNIEVNFDQRSSARQGKGDFSEVIISRNLMEVLSRAISPQPEQRFASAAQMRSALLSSSTVLLTKSKEASLKERKRMTSNTQTLKTGGKVLLISGIMISIAWMGWQITAKLDERPPLNFTDLFAEESLLPTENDVTLGKDLTRSRVHLRPKGYRFAYRTKVPARERWSKEAFSTYQSASPKLGSDVDNGRSGVSATKTNADNAANIFHNIIFTVGTGDREIIKALGEPVWRQPGFWNNSVAWSYKNIVSEGIDLGYLFDVETNKLRQAEIAVPPATSLETLQAALISLLGAKIEPDLEQGLTAVYQRRQTVFNFTVGDLQGVIQRNQQDRIYLAVWSADFH